MSHFHVGKKKKKKPKWIQGNIGDTPGLIQRKPEGDAADLVVARWPLTPLNRFSLGSTSQFGPLLFLSFSSTLSLLVLLFYPAKHQRRHFLLHVDRRQVSGTGCLDLMSFINSPSVRSVFICLLMSGTGWTPAERRHVVRVAADNMPLQAVFYVFLWEYTHNAQTNTRVLESGCLEAW